MNIASNEPISFIQKIWEIMNVQFLLSQRPEFEQYAYWNQEGTSFMIKSVEGFSKEILPKFFKHSNYSSFVRQLNMYGFHKNKSDLTIHQFSHKMFRRGHKQLLPNIKRKALEEAIIPSTETTTRKQINSKETSFKSVKQQEKNPHKDVQTPSAYNNNSSSMLFHPNLCNKCAYNESLIMMLSKQNQQLKYQLQRETDQKNNVIQKCQKFLITLNAELAQREIQNADKNPFDRDQRLSVEKIQEMIDHISSPFEVSSYAMYERYAKSILQFSVTQNSSKNDENGYSKNTHNVIRTEIIKKKDEAIRQPKLQ